MTIGDRVELHKEIRAVAVELLVNLGIMDCAVDAWPEEIQENWVEKLEETKSWLYGQIMEVQSFAEAYDEGGLFDGTEE